MPRRERLVGPEIRPASPADAADIGMLADSVFRAGGWTDDGYSAVLLDGRARIRDAVVFVATLGGAVVGVTLALPGTRFVNVGRSDQTEVMMLAVRDDARGRGIAHALMEACERRSHGEGVAGVVRGPHLGGVPRACPAGPTGRP